MDCLPGSATGASIYLQLLCAAYYLISSRQGLQLREPQLTYQLAAAPDLCCAMLACDVDICSSGLASFWPAFPFQPGSGLAEFGTPIGLSLKGGNSNQFLTLP